MCIPTPKMQPVGVLVEHWDSRAHHGKYHAWRKETGVSAKIGAMLAGPPSTRYFEKIDL